MLHSTIQRRTLATFFFFLLLCKPVLADTYVVGEGLSFLGQADVVEDILILNGGVLLIDGATVLGDIKVRPGGALAVSRATIAGKVESEQALLIELGLSDIGGKVELKRTQGPGTVFGLFPSVIVNANNINGDLKVSRSDVQSFIVSDNVICGKLELSRNRSVFPMVVENNVILRKKDCD